MDNDTSKGFKDFMTGFGITLAIMGWLVLTLIVGPYVKDLQRRVGQLEVTVKQLEGRR